MLIMYASNMIQHGLRTACKSLNHHCNALHYIFCCLKLLSFDHKTNHLNINLQSINIVTIDIFYSNFIYVKIKSHYNKLSEFNLTF